MRLDLSTPCAAVLLLLAAASPTRAQSPPADAAQVAGPPAAPAAAPDADRAAEPSADRVVLMPTAYTHPRGSLYVSSYDVLFLQMGYALTDRTQISLTFVPYLGQEKIFPLDLSLKTALVRRGLVRAAALGSMTGVFGIENQFIAVGRAGAVVDLCLAASCRSSFSLASNVTFIGPVLFMWNAVGVTWRVRDGLAVLAEADMAVPLGHEGGQYNGAALSAGVRFPGTHWSFDLALGRPLAASSNVAALPILALTYRPTPP